MLNYARIFVGGQCNNDCTYCKQKDSRESLAKEAILSQLSWFKERENLEIFGGEPTLRRDLIELIRVVRNGGFKRIKLVTNARVLTDWNAARALIAEGVYFFEVKVWSTVPPIHDGITKVQGSLAHTILGIQNLRRVNRLNNREFKAFIALRIPLCRENYQTLEETIRVLLPLEIDRVIVSMVDPDISLEEAAYFVHNACEFGIFNKVWVQTEGMPFCLMGGFEHHISEVFKQVKEGYAKPETCNQCVYNQVCLGVFKENLSTAQGSLKPLKSSPYLEDLVRVINEGR